MLLFSPLDDLLLTSVEDIIKYQSNQIYEGYRNYINANKLTTESTATYVARMNTNMSMNVK